MRITIFTLALSDSDIKMTINSPLHQLCVSTWNKIVDYIRKQGSSAVIKIYNDDSEEYKKVYNECFKNSKVRNKAHYADAFRLYMLSKHPYYLWLDWDMFIRDNFEFDFTKPFLMYSFNTMYNCDRLDIFQTLYQKYRTNDFNKLNDSTFMSIVKENQWIDHKLNKPLVSMTVHCNFIDNQPVENLYFINDEEESSEFVLQHKNEKNKYRFINIKTPRHNGICGISGEPKLIEYILSNYNLSDEQKNKLLEGLD